MNLGERIKEAEEYQEALNTMKALYEERNQLRDQIFHLNQMKENPRLRKAMISTNYHKEFESEKWLKEIPFIPFKPDWLVKVTPPFGFAIVRFRVKKKGSDKEISIYLDCYNLLGSITFNPNNPTPYWEIYPAMDGDTARFEMNDIEGLVEGIEDALNG